VRGISTDDRGEMKKEMIKEGKCDGKGRKRKEKGKR
jgi:hypothetical protein